MKSWWLRYYFTSFSLLLFLSLVLSAFIPSNLYLEIGEVSLIFFVWYSISPLIMIFSLKLKKNDDSNLEHLVEYTTNLFRMKKPNIFVVRTNYSNALAFGNIFYKAIAYTTGILSSLQDNEIIAVTAHELSHLKNHDMEVQMLGLIGYNILYIYLANISYVFVIIMFIMAFPIFIFFHRLMEKRADITAVKDNRWLTVHLENALIKIGYLGRTIPNYLLKNIPDFQLYFIKQELISNYEDSTLLRTHPSLSERLRYLSKYETTQASSP